MGVLDLIDNKVLYFKAIFKYPLKVSGICKQIWMGVSTQDFYAQLCPTYVLLGDWNSLYTEELQHVKKLTTLLDFRDFPWKCHLKDWSVVDPLLGPSNWFVSNESMILHNMNCPTGKGWIISFIQRPGIRWIGKTFV